MSKARAKEAEMKIVGVDRHAKQQSIAMLDTETGELIEKGNSPRRKCCTRILFGLGRADRGRDRSHRFDAVVLGAAG